MNSKVLAAATGLLLAATSCGTGGKTDNNGGIVTTSGEMKKVAERVALPGGDSLIVVRLTDTPDPVVLRASDLMDDIRLIRLDNSTEDALVGESQIWTSGKRLMIYTGDAIKQFDMDGKYLGVIAHKGGGPGEFVIAPYDLYADEDAGRIYMLTYSANSIQTYDTEGNYLGDIPLAYPAPKGSVRADTKNRRLNITALRFQDGNEPVLAWEQDFDGNVISSFSRPDLTVVPDFSNEIRLGLNGDGNYTYSLFNVESPDDTLYSIVDGKFRPELTVDYADKTPMHSYYSFPRFYAVSTYGAPEATDMPGTYIIPSNQPLVIDRTTLYGAPASIMLDLIGPVVNDNGWQYQQTPDYFIINIEPATMAYTIDETVPSDLEYATEEDYARMREFRESINPEDNNYIFIGRWKK